MAARSGSCRAGSIWGFLPLLNLAAAFVVSGLIVRAARREPAGGGRAAALRRLRLREAVGYTLFYATSFIFTGLAVAIAFHCGLFNIGGEGQAYVGGLGVTLVGLYLGWLPWLAGGAARDRRGRRLRRRSGRSSRAGCRRGAAATS